MTGLHLLIVLLLSAFSTHSAVPNWLIHHPSDFMASDHSTTHLVSVRNNATAMQHFREFISHHMHIGNHPGVDGEHVDALEHFFWGQTKGIILEMGACDGSERTQSMSFGLEKHFQWKRLLIEGNPTFFEQLKNNSQNAFSVGAVICNTSTVHFIAPPRNKYISGILEMMSASYIQRWYPHLHQVTSNVSTGPIWESRSGDLGSSSFHTAPLRLTSLSHITAVECVSMATILHYFPVKHVNLFFLDVEGGELSVLHSIPWHAVQFDVIVVETTPERRPEGFAQQIREFLLTKGYEDVSGQVKMNICK